ncbi:MAG: hypothetical protein U0Z75_09755 [Deinococcaceae bacterium]
MNKSYQRIGFQVRIVQKDNIEELVKRIEPILGCKFTPGYSDNFQGDFAYISSCLGLSIELLPTDILDIEVSQKFGLFGFTNKNLLCNWPENHRYTTISMYILRLLQTLDDENWYIPTKKEILMEAGIYD